MARTKEEWNGLLAELADQEREQYAPREEEDLKEAIGEAKMMPEATEALEAYIRNRSKEYLDLIKDNADVSIKTAFSALTALRHRLSPEILEGVYGYVKLGNWFIREFPEDLATPSIKGALLFINKYFEVLDIKPEDYAYPKGKYYPYAPGEYKKYYEKRELEDLISTPYDQLPTRELRTAKALAHGRRGAMLLRALEGIQDESEEEVTMPQLEQEAIQKIRSEREKKTQELTKSGLKVGPEAYEQWKSKERYRQYELSKQPDKFEQTENRLKAVSRRERVSAGITIEE